MNLQQTRDEVVVMDFETTGLSPHYERIIEVGAVVVKDRQITQKFSALMHPGFNVSSFITRFTGISNEMLVGKPAPEKVMPQLKKFVGNRPILAHNAGFDRGFYQAEMQRAGFQPNNSFLCTMVLSRRLIPDAPNYKLGTLAKHLGIKQVPNHRALEDVEVTAKIWFHLQEKVSQSTGLERPDFSVFEKIRSTPKQKISQYLNSFST